MVANTVTRRRRTPAERDYIARPPKWLMERAKTQPMVLFSESRWQREVMAALKLYGWMAYHTWNSQHSASGFPDIIAFKPGRSPFDKPRFLAWELKRENGKTTAEQEAWLLAFEARGAETGVYRPSQWDEVLRVLQ